MRNIIYLNNYMISDVIEKRNNKNVFSQAANNKINSIRKSLELNDCIVTILSSGLVNNKSFKFYKSFKSKLDERLEYMSILDIPFLNIITSIFSTYRKIKKINKKNQ
ncbi:hypothetical protein R2R32_02720 [Clostridium perfringens]|nr:hypothetical protein [Clostridium perfringens]